MGANGITDIADAATIAGVKRVYRQKRQRESDDGEAQNAYAGNFSTFDGIDVHDNYTKPLASAAEAEKYILDKTEKWGAAMAVFAYADGAAKGAKPSAKKRRLGEKVDAIHAEIETLQTAASTANAKRITDARAAAKGADGKLNVSAFLTCGSCKSRMNPTHLNVHRDAAACPICMAPWKTPEVAKIAAARKRLAVAEAKFAAEPCAVVCVLGGWAAC